jgi:hypothetical protein
MLYIRIMQVGPNQQSRASAVANQMLYSEDSSAGSASDWLNSRTRPHPSQPDCMLF